jgi:hypothetical protein
LGPITAATTRLMPRAWARARASRAAVVTSRAWMFRCHGARVVRSSSACRAGAARRADRRCPRRGCRRSGCFRPSRGRLVAPGTAKRSPRGKRLSLAVSKLSGSAEPASLPSSGEVALAASAATDEGHGPHYSGRPQRWANGQRREIEETSPCAGTHTVKTVPPPLPAQAQRTRVTTSLLKSMRFSWAWKGAGPTARLGWVTVVTGSGCQVRPKSDRNASGPRSTRPPSRPPSASAPMARSRSPVHLVARDKEGSVLNDGEGRHVYEFRGDLVRRMTIEE